MTGFLLNIHPSMTSSIAGKGRSDMVVADEAATSLERFSLAKRTVVEGERDRRGELDAVGRSLYFDGLIVVEEP